MIDVDQQLGAVARSVTYCEVDEHPATVVALEQTYHTHPDDLWNAVTDRRRLLHWFAPVTGDLRLGGRYQIEGNADGTITACDSPHGFDATWEFDGAISWVKVRVASSDAGHARLTLRHIAKRDDHWDQFGPGAGGIGWELAMCGLQLYIATGQEPPPEFGGWPASHDGVRFITGSGRAWADAHVASGEPADTASAAASRTIEVYTESAD